MICPCILLRQPASPVSSTIMSAVIKSRRLKKIPAATPALWAIIMLAIFFFLVRYGQELFMQHDLNVKIAAQRSANSALADENARLAAALQYYQSDKYVEQRAREDLNLRRPDEEVLIPIGDQPQASPDTTTARPEDSAGTTGTTGTTQSPAGNGDAEKPNWQKWFELFTPGSP